VRKPGLSGTFWPTSTQEELLRLVLGERDRISSRWQSLQPLDIETLQVGSFCLLPLLYRRLSEVGVLDPRMPHLGGTYRSTWYRNQLRLERLSKLVEAARTRGIEPIVSGGASLAVVWYPQLGFRPIPQIDVMVRREQGEGARQAAFEAGWQPAGDWADFHRFTGEDGAVLVVHVGVPPYLAGASDAAAAFEAFAGGAQGRRLGDVDVPTLNRCDELLFACGLGARVAVPSIQWLLDAYHLLVARDPLDTRGLLERAREFRLVLPLRETLAYLDDVSEALDIGDLRAGVDAEPITRRDVLAYRLAGASGRRLGGMPQTLALHSRATADDSLARAIGKLPGHLRTIWGIDSATKVPIVATRKAISRILNPLRPSAATGSSPGTAGAVDQSTDGSPLGVRNRSASS
jgi:Uncharacterised nucleotidyltransferase